MFGGCGGGGGGLAGICFGGGGDLLDGRWRGGRASTGAALVVDDLAEAAVLEKNVLAGDEAVGAAGEGVGEGENGRRGAGVFDAGVAVGRDAKAEVVVAGVLEGEADVGVRMTSCGEESVWSSIAPRSRPKRSELSVPE